MTVHLILARSELVLYKPLEHIRQNIKWYDDQNSPQIHALKLFLPNVQPILVLCIKFV